jgi:hypothetical protein
MHMLSYCTSHPHVELLLADQQGLHRPRVLILHLEHLEHLQEGVGWQSCLLYPEWTCVSVYVELTRLFCVDWRTFVDMSFGCKLRLIMWCYGRPRTFHLSGFSSSSRGTMSLSQLTAVTVCTTAHGQM